MSEPCASKIIDTNQKERFLRDGYLSPLTIMTPAEAAACRTRLEVIEARSHGRLSGIARTKPHLLMPFLWDIVMHPRILDAVEGLLGPDLLCIGSSIIDKPASSDGYVAWHQDATFWGLSEADGATAWLALSPATRETGCMEVVPGTHKSQLAHLDTGDAQNMLGAREAVRQPVDVEQAQALELAPGQMSLHHPLVLHGSARNRGTDRRLGFVIRYVPAHVSQDGATATLVRGRNLSRMPEEIEPLSDFEPAAVARHPYIIRQAAGVIRRAKTAHIAAVAGAQEVGE